MPLIVINERVRISKRERNRMQREQKRIERMEVKPQNQVLIRKQAKKIETEVKKVFVETEKQLLKLQHKRQHDMRIHKRLAKFYQANKMWPEVEEQQEILEILGRIKRINNRNRS